LHRSKLQICIEILCSLSSRGSIKLSEISDIVDLDKVRLIPYLRLLRNRNLIEKQNLGENKIFYVVTERGLKVLKVVDPIIKAAYKIQIRNLEVISSILSAANL
jgi:predicted transcriptional regulator